VTVGEVKAILSADLTKFRAGLLQANSLLDQAGASAMKASAMLAGFGAAVAGGMGMAVRESIEIQAALADLNKVLKLSDDALEELAKRLDVLGMATGIADEALAEALANIGKAGLAGAEGMQVLEAATRAAVAGRADIKLAGDALVSIIRAYNLHGSEAAKVTDALYQASIKGRMSLEAVSEAVKGMAPIASQLGVSYVDLAAALATTTTVGYDAENSIMGLSRAMINLTNPGKQLQAALKAAGYETGQALIQAKGFTGAIQFLTEAAGDDEQAMIQMAGGARAYKAVVALAADGGRLFAQKLAEIADSAGAVDTAFGMMEKTFSFQWSRFVRAMKEAGEAVGNVLLPGLTLLARILAALVGTVQLMPGPLRTVVVGAVSLAAAIAALAGSFILFKLHLAETIVLTGRLVISLASAVVAAIAGSATLQAALAGLRAALIATRVAIEFFFISTGPIGWTLALLAAVGAVVAALVLWYKHQANLNRQAEETHRLTQQQAEDLANLLDHLQKLQVARLKEQAAGKPANLAALKDEADTQDKIADLYPKLIDYVDKYGHAHLIAAKSLETLTEVQKKNRQAAIASAAAQVAEAAQRRSDLADQLAAAIKMRERFEALPPSKQAFILSEVPGMRGKSAAQVIEEMQSKEKDLRAQVRAANAEYEERQKVLHQVGMTQERIAREQAAADAKGRAEAHRGLVQRLAAIDQEAAALRRLGVTADDINRWVAVRRLEAYKKSSDEILKLQAQVLEAEGKKHAARLVQIEIESNELLEKAKTAKVPEPERKGLVRRFIAGELKTAAKEAADAAREKTKAALEAEGQLAEVLKQYENDVAGVRAYVHNVRMRQIRAEADEIKRQMVEAQMPAARAEIAAREYVTAKSIELAKEEADARAAIFEKSAPLIVSRWQAAASAMYEAGTMKASEYLASLARQLDLIHQINLAQAAAGRPALLRDEEMRLAQTIFSERKRMLSELESAEKRLADERKRWSQEELEQRRRVHEAELSMISLSFEHQRDLLKARGIEDQAATARIASDELAALQLRRQTEMLTGQERLESLQRERDLVMQMAEAQMAPAGGARGALEAIYTEMVSARQQMALEDKRAFEERRREANEAVTKIETEQTTLRSQIALTATNIADAARRVFEGIRNQLEMLGTVRIVPTVQMAAVGGRAVPTRVNNFYISGQRVGAGVDIDKIADQLAAMLEREHQFARD
jgi:TP901 family phage tail tape measure protein